MEKNNRFLKNLYLAIIIAIYILILVSPFIVKFLNFEKMEIAEFIILLLLLSLGFCANHFYKIESKLYEQKIILLEKDRDNLKKRIESAFKYIGSINIQLEEFNSIFTKIGKYPKTKQEMKIILSYFAEKILIIANTEWVLLRLVNIEKTKTLTEIFISRDKDKVIPKNISNKYLINNMPFDNLSAISSTDETFIINTYFIFPAIVNNEQKYMIETIANQAEMLYIIYSSNYYKSKKLLI